MSRMNGGEFFKFIFDCWHCFTTLSISFHVFSKVRLSITNFGGAMASVKAPCKREISDEIFFGCPFRALPLVAILIALATARRANPPDAPVMNELFPLPSQITFYFHTTRDVDHLVGPRWNPRTQPQVALHTALDGHQTRRFLFNSTLMSWRIWTGSTPVAELFTCAVLEIHQNGL